jgi:TPR repeat protein
MGFSVMDGLVFNAAAFARRVSMRTSFTRVSRVALVVFGVIGYAAAAQALEPASNSASIASAPIPLFKDPRAALRMGIQGYQAGDFEASVPALKYAADGGQPLARWKLGQMYAAGDGVPHDDYKAFQYFSQIVSAYDDDLADPREKPVVSSAFVSVGVYSLSGIPNSSVRRNPQRALEMFHYAATNFGDADAQYHLGRMYLDGNGVPKNARQAMPWLNYAADKNHAEAQALLGNILFSGAVGMPMKRSLGLMYLTLARESASEQAKHTWIVDLYEQAMRSASDFDKQLAHVELGQHLNRRTR